MDNPLITDPAHKAYEAKRDTARAAALEAERKDKEAKEAAHKLGVPE